MNFQDGYLHDRNYSKSFNYFNFFTEPKPVHARRSIRKISWYEMSIYFLRMFYRSKLRMVVYITAFLFVYWCFFVLVNDEDSQPSSSQIKIKESSDHKLAVLVPFRDRFNELLSFAPHMTKFLSSQSIKHQIFILNQVDTYRFNRASLINVGFKFVSDEYDYLAMHDVDLLPLNNQLKYSYPKTGVFHVSSPPYHPKYDYPTFLGGIVLIKSEDFRLVNGMSNRYWGWGLEDDEFYVRLKDANIEVVRPVNLTTGKNNTFLHIHDKNIRKRDMRKCFNQKNVTHKRDRETGLHDVDYAIQSVQEMFIDGSHLIVLNIKLNCNRSLTPWCMCEPLPLNQSIAKSQKSTKSGSKF